VPWRERNSPPTCGTAYARHCAKQKAARVVTGDHPGQHELQGGYSEDPLAAIAAASTGRENLTMSDDAVAVDGEAVTEAAGRLLTRGTAAGDPKRVRRAVELSESALAAARAGTASYVGAAANAARALTAEYEMTGRGGALDRAVALLDSVEHDAGLLEGREADFFALLGQALLHDAGRTGDPGIAARAVAARRRALQLTRRGDSAYPGRLGDLGAVLAVQFRVAGDPSALKEAVRLYEAACKRFDPSAPEFPGLLSNMGTCLDEVAVREGGIPVLDRAARVQREALAAADRSGPLRPMIKANLGVTLLHLHQETGARDALTESIELHRAAVAGTPEAHSEHQARRTNLAVALQTLYEETGDLDVLDEAIEIFQQAADVTPRAHAQWFRYQHDLSSALMRLAERNGDLSAIDEAIQAWQDAVDGTPDRHPSKPGRLSALGTARFIRFQGNPGSLSLVDAGIENLRDALRLSPPDHDQRPMLLTNLGALLMGRFEHSGEQRDLDEAIRASRDAITASAEGQADRHRYLSNFGVALVHKARASEKLSDSNEAIEAVRRALETVPPGDPGRADTLIALGSAYARAFELGDSEALTPGLEAFREACDMEIAATTTRIRAGRDGGRLAAAAGATSDALGAFAAAVRLMEEAAWAGLRRADQQRLLGEMNGLPMDAAAMAISAGRLGDAVMLLELGRGVLLARQFEGRGIHAQLRNLAPEIGEELAALQVAIDEAEQASGGEVTGREVAARRSRIARQRAAVLDRLRADPRLQDLAAPPRLNELLAAGTEGPVVIVNVSEHRCDALIVAADTVRVVPLLRITREDVAAKVQALLAAADAMKTLEVDDVLEWAWDCIVEPVLADLGLGGPPAAGHETRVWWCATGLAAFLPLHAAGAHRSSTPARSSALDRAISSYTPSLRTLIRLRQRQPAQEADLPGPLIVAMPQTPGLPALESASDEASSISRRCSEYEMLTGTSATRNAVAQAMPRHQWAHFACHGSQDLANPFSGALHLHDGPLTIAQIPRLRLPAPVLAYVSACDTSRGSTVIPDEGITLANALQIAGYQHVVAGLWQIHDATAAEVAKRFYDRGLTGGEDRVNIAADTLAAALRDAVISLREESPEMPAMYWAPYIHTGP
jgi:tetratricopeptide (TPR) repeat protein